MTATRRKTLVEKRPDQEMTCGWGPLTSRWLQRFRRMSCLAACLSFCSFFNGINYGAISVALTSLERRYSLSSKMSGLIAATAHIGGVITVLFLKNVENNGHKPRMLACGALVSALSCVFRVMPHLLSEPYLKSGHLPQPPLCTHQTNKTGCADSQLTDVSSSMALAYLLVGQFLVGAGFSPVISLAPGLFAENSADSNAKIYVAASNVMSAVGVAGGFLLGALSLTVFVDITKEIYIDYNNPRWIGAWWLMFVTSGTFMFIFSFILFAFPAKLYTDGLNTTSTRTKRKSVRDYRKSILEKSKALLTATCKLVKNPAFLFFNLCGILEHFFVSALFSFGSKLFEQDFELSAADAGLAMGSILTAAAAAGTIGGGLLMTKLTPNPRILARLCTLFSLLAATGAIAYLYRCDGSRIAGLHDSYNPLHTPNSEDLGMTTDGCNAHCGCDVTLYSPVCGSNNVTYFSPCHAGCETVSVDKARLMLNFSNCACVKDEQCAVRNQRATDGKCQRHRCDRLYSFFVLLLLGASLRAMVIPPLVSLIFGCVPAKETTFALGVNFLSVKIFGAIPGPIVLGFLTDKSCQLWKETCDGRGQCWVYNIDVLNMHMCFLWLCTSVLSAVLTFLGSFLLPDYQSSSNTQQKLPITDEDKPDTKSQSSDSLYEMA